MKNVICVLGMHRSGTSLLMKVLKELGLYLGKDEDIEAFGMDNPEGFWEHKKIVDIHEKILGELERNWDSLAPLPEGWLKNPKIQEYKRELVELIKHEFGEISLWGWKDPRTCILLPLWKEIYDVLDIETHYIIPLRNPLDVANSLFKRNGMSKQKGIALWYYYMINVLEYTKGHKKLIVEYDTLLENSLENIKEIADFTGLEFNKEKEKAINKIIKSNLRHSQSSYKELCLYTEERAALLYKNIKDILESENNGIYDIGDYQFYTRLIELEKIEKKIENLKNKYVEVKSSKNELVNVRKEIEQKDETVVEEIEQKDSRLESVTSELQQKDLELKEALEEIRKIEIELNQQELNNMHLVEQINKLKNINEQMSIVANKAKYQSISLSNTKLFKIVHFIYRIKHQLLKGDMVKKQNFIQWFFKRWNKNIYINDHTYNPMYQIVNILDEFKFIERDEEILETAATLAVSNETVGSEIAASMNNILGNLNVNFKERYNKFDVIFLSIINYDFRYQRPQHLANIFAQKNHRVFFINTNFSKSKIQSKHASNNLSTFTLRSNDYKNIYELINGAEINRQIEEMIIRNGIRDCLVVVEYPTWLDTTKLLKEKYGFRVVTDYLDDYTGFKDTNNSRLAKTSVELLECSDKVIASSNYLALHAQEYNENIDIVRNGTEFEHFNKTVKLKSEKSKQQVIGYFGAIAHWFDFEKVELLATNLQDTQIVIIGAVTSGFDRLSKFSNVELLGEKPYKELPHFLKDFDVCIIPFDTKTDLIKATNPVKFYEYLSAGKKIVATEIPELMPYKDKYVYLTNDNNQFLKYVSMCLENKDTLAAEAERINFARENDWSKRGEAFLNYSKDTFPKVSIIILTYNQLEYTQKCISSILEKTAYPNYELIIIDNNSQDNSPAYLKKLEEEFSHVKVILNDENYGFAGGNNIGLKHATGDYIILLNNDTVVTRGWITGLIKHFENNPNLGLVGPVTNSIGNEAMIKVDYTNLEKMDSFAYKYTTRFMGQLYKDINSLAMYCLVIPRKVFETVGFLDENYKVGMFEDDDYSFATIKAGFDISCAEDVFIHHFGSVSFKKLEDNQYKHIFESNKKYFENKWNTKWIPHKYREDL